MSELAVVPGHVVAWRAWLISGWLERPRLRSLFSRVAWPTSDWLSSECERGDHRGHAAPNELCSCGIYAARSRSHLVALGYAGYLSNEAYPAVIGEVALAGVVIPAVKGFRAERARPLRLFVPHQTWELVRPLAAAYSVPVELANTLEEVRVGHRS